MPGWLPTSRRDRIATLVALLLPIAVTAVLIPFRTTLPSTVAVLLLVTVVVGVAANGYRGAGLLASVSAAVWFDFFLTRPYEQFAINRRADIETTVLIVIVGAVVTELAVRGRRHHHTADTRGSYLTSISTVNDIVSSGGSALEVVGLVEEQLTALLDLESCDFQAGRFGSLPLLEGDGEIRVDSVTWDVERDDLPSGPVELRVQSSTQAHGRFVMTFKPGARPGIAARQVAVVLANQAGAAFNRQRGTSRRTASGALH